MISRSNYSFLFWILRVILPVLTMTFIFWVSSYLQNLSKSYFICFYLMFDRINELSSWNLNYFIDQPIISNSNDISMDCLTSRYFILELFYLLLLYYLKKHQLKRFYFSVCSSIFYEEFYFLPIISHGTHSPLDCIICENLTEILKLKRAHKKNWWLLIKDEVRSVLPVAFF
jgi:hypothetical protein